MTASLEDTQQQGHSLFVSLYTPLLAVFYDAVNCLGAFCSVALFHCSCTYYLQLLYIISEMFFVVTRCRFTFKLV